MSCKIEVERRVHIDIDGEDVHVFTDILEFARRHIEANKTGSMQAETYKVDEYGCKRMTRIRSLLDELFQI